MTKRKQAAAKKPADSLEAPDWPAAKKPEMRPLSRIVPHPQNPKTHPPAQITLLADLMKRYGVDQPIVVDEDGVILKGHGRRLSAIAAGFEEFPVVVHEGLSDADKIAMRISDNQVPLLGGWDKELIKADIGSLKAAGYDVALLGFGEQQLVQFTTTPGPPAGFPTFGSDIPTDYCCPKCGYSWSGNPAAGAPKGESSETPPSRSRNRGSDGTSGKEPKPRKT